MRAQYIMDDLASFQLKRVQQVKPEREVKDQYASGRWRYSGKSSVYGEENGGERCRRYQQVGEITQWTGRAGRQMGRERGAAEKGRPKISLVHTTTTTTTGPSFTFQPRTELATTAPES